MLIQEEHRPVSGERHVHQVLVTCLCKAAKELMGESRGGRGGGGHGVRTPTAIVRLLIFAMLKFSVRPFWEFGPTLRKFSGSAHGAM